MDCNTARMLVTFFGRQGTELAPQDATDLETHLSSCPKCADLVKFERAFDDRVAKAMLAVPVPAGLKSKLLDGIAAHRGSWYREKFFAIAGVAAMVALTVVAVVAYQIGTAPVLTQGDLVREADAKVQNPAKTVADLLGQHGLEFNPERPLDLNQFVGGGDGTLLGRTVPVLFLVNGSKNARAEVYIVRKSDFDWTQMPRDGSSVPSVYGHQVAVLRDTRRSDVAYVVIFTGAGLELFLEERSPT